MKRTVPYLCGIILLQMLLTTQTLKAQSKPANTLKPPPADLQIDGDLKEWGDSLRYYNDDKKLYFSLANDKENLYMAIRFADRLDQKRVLGAGLTLGINTKGKEKETFALTFPEVEKGTGPGAGMAGMARKAEGGDITQEDRDELAKARLTTLRNIKVKGFEKDIEGEIVTTTNTYGIKAAVNYDSNGYLVYEVAIPIKFFHADNPGKYEWAFNFKVNGLTKPTMGGGGQGGEGGGPGGGMGGGGGRRGGGGMGGGGGRRGGGGGNRGGETGGDDRSELFKSYDFWAKYYLGS